MLLDWNNESRKRFLKKTLSTKQGVGSIVFTSDNAKVAYSLAGLVIEINRRENVALIHVRHKRIATKLKKYKEELSDNLESYYFFLNGVAFFNTLYADKDGNKYRSVEMRHDFKKFET